MWFTKKGSRKKKNDQDSSVSAAHPLSPQKELEHQKSMISAQGLKPIVNSPENSSIIQDSLKDSPKKGETPTAQIDISKEELDESQTLTSNNKKKRGKMRDFFYKKESRKVESKELSDESGNPMMMDEEYEKRKSVGKVFKQTRKLKDYYRPTNILKRKFINNKDIPESPTDKTAVPSKKSKEQKNKDKIEKDRDKEEKFREELKLYDPFFLPLAEKLRTMGVVPIAEAKNREEEEKEELNAAVEAKKKQLESELKRSKEVFNQAVQIHYVDWFRKNKTEIKKSQKKFASRFSVMKKGQDEARVRNIESPNIRLADEDSNYYGEDPTNLHIKEFTNDLFLEEYINDSKLGDDSDRVNMSSIENLVAKVNTYWVIAHAYIGQERVAGKLNNETKIKYVEKFTRQMQQFLLEIDEHLENEAFLNTGDNEEKGGGLKSLLKLDHDQRHPALKGLSPIANRLQLYKIKTKGEKTRARSNANAPKPIKPINPSQVVETPPKSKLLL